MSELKPLSKEEREFHHKNGKLDPTLARALHTIDELEKGRDAARLAESDLLIGRMEAITVIEKLKSRQKKLVEALRKIKGGDIRDGAYYRLIASEALRDIGEGDEG